MKISEILSKIDFSKKKKFHLTNGFLQEFNLTFHTLNKEKLNCELFYIEIILYPPGEEYWDKYKIILWNNIPICILWNEKENSQWLNKEIYIKIRTCFEQARKIKIILADLEREFELIEQI